jgi:hypothetical protein
MGRSLRSVHFNGYVINLAAAYLVTRLVKVERHCCFKAIRNGDKSRLV